MSPFVDPEELKGALPHLKKQEKLNILELIYDRLKVTMDNKNIKRLLENKEILERDLANND